MGAEPARESPRPSARRRIAVVDDNEILVRLWRRLLEKMDCEAFITSSPEAVMRHLQSNNVDILIADVVMPTMDGFDLVRQVKEVMPDLRIILTTGYPCDFTRIRLRLDARDVHVLMKPYNNIQGLKNFLTRVLSNDQTLDTDEDSFRNPDDIRIHVWNL